MSILSKHRLRRNKKRVKAKKTFNLAYIKEYETKLDECLPEINKELLCEVSRLIEMNPAASLKEIEKKYRKKIIKAISLGEGKTSSEDNSSIEYEDEILELMIESSSQEQQFVKRKKSDVYSYYKTETSKKEFTESYLVLGTFFQIYPYVPTENTLDALLEIDFGLPDEGEQVPVCYMEVKNVVKSKGNSINGPHREDIGMFNRKLFESYCNDLEKEMQNRVIVNLEFYPEIDRFIGDEEVISADPVSIFKFNGPSKEMLGDFIFIAHMKGIYPIFSAVNTDGSNVLFNRLSMSNVLYSRGKDKRRIQIFHLETFTIFVIEFLSASIATKVYKSVFGELPDESSFPPNFPGFF